MDDSKYIISIDDFMQAHPELDPSLKEIIEPLFTDTQNQMMAFVLSLL
jgi:hypothetical protein